MKTYSKLHEVGTLKSFASLSRNSSRRESECIIDTILLDCIDYNIIERECRTRDRAMVTIMNSTIIIICLG